VVVGATMLPMVVPLKRLDSRIKSDGNSVLRMYVLRAPVKAAATT
jgi:hypothetical protein